MNCESLYEEFKWKKYQQESMQEQQNQRIRDLSQIPKVTAQSNLILNTKLFQELQRYPDHQMVTLETSIPILHCAHILELITSIEQAKNKLNSLERQHYRLKWEAKFVFYLWKLLNKDEIETRRLKELIYLFHQKKGRQLKQILYQMFQDSQSLEQLLETWKMLSYDRQYYRQNNRTEMQAEKQNQTLKNQQETFIFKQKHSPMSKNYSMIGKNTLGETNSFLQKGLGYSCVLSVEKQKELVNRLYRNDIYKHREDIRKEQQQRKQEEELENCTFKPHTNHRGRSRSHSKNKNIKGYDKAVSRLRNGTEKNRQKKQRRQYKPIGQNYEKIREKGINPPKFLTRKKQEEKVLFMISFDLGRHKTNVKIKEGQSEQEVAARLCKIYSLKQQYFDQICKIIRSELELYYKQQYEKQIYENQDDY